MSEGRLEQPWDNDPGFYEELDVLGSGAYGTVYTAKNRLTGVIVAKKVIRVAISEEGVPQSLVREISSLKLLDRFNHPNICKLLDVTHGVRNNGLEMYVNLIFEKCDWDLHQFLSTVPRGLPEGQVRNFARQMLAGLDFLHTQNIIHRDLKPQNILVTRDGVVKIHDFGLARTYSHISFFTTVVVTLWYRAPEVLLQCNYASPVDLWSCGCILAELYLRRALFQGQTERDQLLKIFSVMGTPMESEWSADSVVTRANFLGFDPVPLPRIIPQLCSEGESIIKSLLAFVPENRLSARSALMHPYVTGLVNN